jgi:hypothetical protein
MTAPGNLVHGFVGGIACRLLSIRGQGSMFSAVKFFAVCVKIYIQLGRKLDTATLSSADQTQMKVLCDIDVNIRIGGLNLPCTFAVVENLGFQAVLGHGIFARSKSNY